MAKRPSQKDVLYKFLQDGKPSALATMFSENPRASMVFLNLRNQTQLKHFIGLLRSDANDDVQYALNRIDSSLVKRRSLLHVFLEDEEPAPSSKKGSAQEEFKENIVMAAHSAGRTLRNLAPWRFKPYEAFRDSVRCLTESIAATLSALGLNKTQRHIAQLTIGLPTFAVLSAKAAGTMTGIVMSFSAMTGDAEAALPPPAPEPVQHALELDATRFGPTVITVTPNNQLHSLTSNFMQAKLGEIPFLSLTENGTIQYQNWRVSHDVAAATITTAEIIDIPAPLMFAMIGPESSFIADNFNESTNACGLGQFIPSTLHEKVYNYAGLVGYPHLQKLVERYVSRRDDQGRPYYGFKAISEEAAEQIQEACMDPELNTRLNAVYISRNVGTLQERLKELAPRGYKYYPVNYTETYLAHFSGISRATRMIEDMHQNNGQALAHMFFNRQATNANLNYLFVNGDRDKPRTVKDFITFLKIEKGLGDGLMPDMRNWSERRTAIENNMLAVQDRSANLPTKQLSLN